jgi:hypothetical protein
MKIILTCPNCGCSEWTDVDEDGCFQCESCGEAAFPENMTAKVENSTKERTM